MFLKKLFFLISITPLIGCTTFGQVSMSPMGNQEKIFQNGNEALISEREHIVTVTLNNNPIQQGHTGDFVIAVQNRSDENILFSTENVTAHTVMHDDIKVYSYQELVDAEKKRQAWAAVGAALQGAGESMQAANAGRSYTYGTYSGSAYSNYGTSAYGYGSYSGYTYDHSAAMAAQNEANVRNQARMNQLQQQGEANLSQLASTILRKETVFPGNWHGGMVKIAIPPATEQTQVFFINVDVQGEQHIFKFEQVRAK